MNLSIHLEGKSLQLSRSLRNPRHLMKVAGAYMASSAQRKLISGKWVANSALTQAVKGSSKPLQDRGQLLASQTYRLDGDTKAVIGYRHPGASVLHNGATIRPKRAKFLTLPAGPRTRSMMRRYGFSPRACMEGMKAAGYRVWPIIGGHGQGAGVIMAAKGKAQAFVLFRLKKSVKIPARPWLRPDARDHEVLSALMGRFARGQM